MPLEITLSSAQLQALARIAEDRPCSVTIRNEGDSFLFLDLHDKDGTVIDRFRMPYEEPTLVRMGH